MTIKLAFIKTCHQSAVIQAFTFMLALMAFSCSEQIAERTTIYSNGFEDGDLREITGGKLIVYGSSSRLGNYNKGGFSVALANLPKHDMLEVSFDLFLHDSWDGNRESPNGPDIWGIAIGEGIFETTFSNSVCNSSYCLKQSYPNSFPFTNEPKTGAQRRFMPSLCTPAERTLRTTQYRITKYFKHSEKEAIIEFYDRLVQSNTGNQSCDESWSLDNLAITSILVN